MLRGHRGRFSLSHVATGKLCLGTPAVRIYHSIYYGGMMKIINTQLVVPWYVQKVSEYQWKSTNLIDKTSVSHIIQWTVPD